MKRVACMLVILCMVSLYASTDYSSLDGSRIGILTGSSFEESTRECFPNSQYSYFNQITDLIVALQQDKIAAFIVDQPIAVYITTKNKGLTYSEEKLSEDKYAWAFSNSGFSKELLAQANEFLDACEKNGTLKEQQDIWFTANDERQTIDRNLVNKNGVVRVAINSSLEPFVYLRNQEYVGYDISLLYMFCREYGYSLELYDMDFASVLPSLASQKMDMATCCITWTEERAKSVAFSNPNYIGGAVVVSKKKMSGSLTPTDASATQYIIDQHNGKKVAIKVGSIFDKTAQKYFPDSEIDFTKGLPESVLSIKQDKTNFVLLDQPIARYLVASEPELYLYPETLEPDRYAAITPKTPRGKQLIQEFNAFFETFKQSSEFHTMEAAWFDPENTDITIIEDLPNINGVLKLATALTQTPFDFVRNGKPQGYEIDIISRFCKEKGYALEIYDMEFGSIIPGIVTGKFDMAVAAFSITEERAKSVYFSDPLYEGGIAVVTKQSNAATKEESADTIIQKFNGKNAGVNTGTIFDKIVGKYFPEATLSFYNDIPSLIVALHQNKIDFVLLDEPNARSIVSEDPSIMYYHTPLEPDSYAAILPKSEDGVALQKQINEFVTKLKDDGTLSEMEKYWFDASIEDKAIISDLPNVNGVLKVATQLSNVPFAYVEDGKPAGFELDVLARFCKDAGLQMQVYDMNFDALLPSIISEKFDIAVACISITEERAKSINYTMPFYNGGIVVATLNEDAVAAGNADAGEKTGFFAKFATSFKRNFLDEDRYKLVFDGLYVTIIISVFSALFGTIVGFGICMQRRAKNKFLSGLAACFIRIIQGLPIVVMLMILYYVVFGASPIPAIIVAIIGFSINFGVYVSEMMRTGIDAVDKGQIEAANALGFGKVKTFVKIVMPQAARHFIPVYKGEFISMVKMTSVVGYIAILDLTKVSDIIRSRTYEAFFPLLSTALIYFVISYFFIYLIGLLENKLDPMRRKRTIKGVTL